MGTWLGNLRLDEGWFGSSSVCLLGLPILLKNIPTPISQKGVVRNNSLYASHRILLFMRLDIYHHTEANIHAYYFQALRQFRSSSSSSSKVTFTVKYLPYQLYPEASQEGEDKYEWYFPPSPPPTTKKNRPSAPPLSLTLSFSLSLSLTQTSIDLSNRYKKSRYGDSEEKMKMYTALMSAYGESAGIQYRFDGIVANTLQAHRMIQHFQEEKGPEVADKIVNCKVPNLLLSIFSPNYFPPAHTQCLFFYFLCV